MLHFKHALLSPQLALGEAARWTAPVTKTTCLKDNFREINQREHNQRAAQVWDHSRGHTQLQLPPTAPSRFPPSLRKPQAHHTQHGAPEKSKCLHCSGTDGRDTEQSSSEWRQARATPLPSVKFPVRVMTTNTLPSGSKSTWKKRKGNVRRLVSLRQKFDNIWRCIYSHAHLNWKKK